jgi:hypothetical protein
VDGALAELRRNSDAALFPGNGVAHEDLGLPVVEDEEPPVAAPEKRTMVGVVGLGATAVSPQGEGESLAAYAVGRVEDGVERDPPTVIAEEPEEGRLPVVGAEAEEELRVCGEAAPPLADEGDTRQGRGQRGQAEEDFLEDVAAVGRGAGRGSRSGRKSPAAAVARLVGVLGHAGSRGIGVGDTHERWTRIE